MQLYDQEFAKPEIEKYKYSKQQWANYFVTTLKQTHKHTQPQNRVTGVQRLKMAFKF